jgi:hypothetical protein
MYIREKPMRGRFYSLSLSLSYLFTPLDIVYVGAGLMWIYFNSCIVYTIPAHITYSTANSFLHTRPYTPADIWQHMFTYLDSPLYLAGQKKLLMLNDDEIYIRPLSYYDDFTMAAIIFGSVYIKFEGN